MLLTHLHSDHITDLNDVITSRWVMSAEDEWRALAAAEFAGRIEVGPDLHRVELPGRARPGPPDLV